MARTYPAEQRVTFIVTTLNNGRGVASGVLCETMPTRNNRGSSVFLGSASRLYNEDLTQLEGEVSRVPQLAVAAEN
jgi:hypothetical protein